MGFVKHSFIFGLLATAFRDSAHSIRSYEFEDQAEMPFLSYLIHLKAMTRSMCTISILH